MKIEDQESEREERESYAVERTGRAPEQRTAIASEVQEDLPRESFCKKNFLWGEKLGIRRLKMRSPLINFFFHNEVCMPRGGKPFCS